MAADSHAPMRPPEHRRWWMRRRGKQSTDPLTDTRSRRCIIVCVCSIVITCICSAFLLSLLVPSAGDATVRIGGRDVVDMASKSTVLNAPRAVTQAILARAQSEGVGATVRRSIGTAQLQNLDPFLMCVRRGAKAVARTARVHVCVCVL